MKKAFPLTLTIPCIISIIAGSVVYYLWGYKDDNPVVIGGAAMLAGGAWLLMCGRAKDAFAKDDNDWFRKIFIYLVFGFLILMNWFLVVVAENLRVDNILKNGRTKTTIAIVTQLNNYRTKAGSYRRHAIINYQTDHENLSISISNSDQKYKWGDTLEIKYSLEYPDMVVVNKILSGR